MDAARPRVVPIYSIIIASHLPQREKTSGRGGERAVAIKKEDELHSRQILPLCRNMWAPSEGRGEKEEVGAEEEKENSQGDGWLCKLMAHLKKDTLSGT